MSTRTLLLPTLAAALIVAAATPARDGKPTAPPPRAKRLTEAEVRRLIDRLASEDFGEREAATEALKRRPEAAVFIIRASRTATSPEVQGRLNSILPVMMSRAGAQKRLARLPEYAKHRQVDRLIETMVACREFLTPEHDAPVRALVKDIHAAAMSGKKPLWTSTECPDFKTFAWYNRPGQPNTETPSIVDRVASSGARGLIAADRIEGRVGAIGEGVALCNGDVVGISHHATTMFGAGRSIIIATGSVQLNSADATVIVCPGDVVVSSCEATAVLVTAGRVRQCGKLGWRDKKYSIIRERDAEFFHAWQLYSAAEAGAELWSAFGVVRVRAIAPDSPFARTGIRPGDILTQINGTPVRSIRDANRLLCRATVSWGAADMTIFRGRNRHERFVPLYEW